MLQFVKNAVKVELSNFKKLPKTQISESNLQIQFSAGEDQAAS